MDFNSDIVLEDSRVLLRRYHPFDMPQLQNIMYDEDIWRFMPTKISNQEELEVWQQTVENGYITGTRYTFIIVDKASGKIAGSTSFGNISAADKRLEIGWTWLTKDFRGTGLNRHCKFLLLQYAFEELKYERVELKTDVLNMRSRKAMLKIGATEEGTLRSHTLMHDGRRRDTIYYSILKPEWEKIRNTIFSDFNSHRALAK
ncbi:RimJ/RimL family protein N-acetyltransferase [Pontibacter aydingkolensis]|uniref:GNAT family N-acetyltransferase n=1 Tax=Pontibacter aydingkolensis TaxID=1911536 RepID=A0ABS7CUW6_9BACT|nr:GNAT family protein [Pontibacter aydingkolensis]MBW7467627.1 GNAT family N-acetyltransferase [Pontibacter aydingkolensis]